MIHLPLDRDELVQAIEKDYPTWTNRARGETETNRSAGKYVSKSTLWSDIKPIFVAHQQRKCAYCERKLGSAGIEWDLEHFRPKKRVDEWSLAPGDSTQTGSADERGYFLLAFEPRNYLAACKPCNTIHKRNFFPIAGSRMAIAPDVASTRTERPYLLNPLDPEDTPPERLIGFFGITPRPRPGPTKDRRRAAVTIKVLGLARPDLDLARAETVMHMWNALRLQENSDAAVREEGREALEVMTASGSPFAACARSFQDLYAEDRPKAREIGQAARKFVRSNSP